MATHATELLAAAAGQRRGFDTGRVRTRQTRNRRGASMPPMLSTAKNIAVVAAAALAVAAPTAGAAAPQPSDSMQPSAQQQQRGYGGYGYHCHRVYRYGHVYRVCHRYGW